MNAANTTGTSTSTSRKAGCLSAYRNTHTTPRDQNGAATRKSGAATAKCVLLVLSDSGSANRETYHASACV